MKILQVIHGYPMRYNAGSEVYTKTLCQELSKRHEVHVFTREENPFAPDFSVREEFDPSNPDIRLHLVNNPRLRDCYRVEEIDQRFSETLERIQPDVVHIGHLNHLSTSIVSTAKQCGIPVVFTLHDYWLMCPRGQFMQMFPVSDDPWAVCDGQENQKCAERCYSRYNSGAEAERSVDVRHWTNWVDRRMSHLREMAGLVDVFIAPSKYLMQRFQNEFGIPEEKLRYIDYGFELDRFEGRKRKQEEGFTFGYIGTHIPAKGINHLIEAFGRLEGEPRLRIWGRARSQETEALKALAYSLPNHAASRIKWMGEYNNEDIVTDVFNHTDAIVVPSVWVENSPLVIHEAQQARVPVITANVGGMQELVQHGVNGLLFEHRDPVSLAEQMQVFVDQNEMAEQCGQRGYLFSDTGDIPCIEAHALEIESIYGQLSPPSAPDKQSGPWRITFDTNPDTCNLRCIMCEEHSPHSKLQDIRRAAGKPRRNMPFEMIQRVVQDAASHGLREIIPSTMGEPLLYENFDGMIELCHTHGVMLNLTTNGTFPKKGAKAWAETIVPVTSDVKISWNGASAQTQEAIMLGTRWERVLQNVKDFVAVRDSHASAGGNRCRVTFQLTFIEQNVEELAEIIRLAVSLGVDRVKGHHLWAHFNEIQGQSMRRSPESIRRWNQAVEKAEAVAESERLPNGKRVLLENIFKLNPDETGDIAPGGECPFLGNEAWVSAEGRFDPCCAPDAQRRTLGEFGSLHEQGFMQIWNSEQYGGLQQSYPDHSLCKSCNMRKPKVEA